ncbi:signal transduction histidine kinase/ligand-binding sensor domain-containing protein [Granulicella aggregans]|uniref:Signal transduction histidine kinase/ligand-binding sensor domain-containing protein n=1 Tax=Granulicella aggregans TaxID=474949 RepID=A0A7W7ZD81_9BACT|nr:sensor histidine kinase [Granulicella aggregans]MBB5057434.1 signal transduction histidine kinase/ligand-binding sensor domain-containing protein [Granulicella aggregans]
MGLSLVLASGYPRPITAQPPRPGQSNTADTDATARKSGLQPPPPSPSFQGITHTSWTRRDGAPGGVKTLAQTRDGYLWIGSSLGLYRFDGLRFFQYPLGSSTPSLDICSLAADLDGGLWIAMCSATVVHLQTDGSMVTYSHDDGVPAGALDKVICRPDGSVWLTGSNSLLRFEGKRWIDFGTAHGIGPEGVFAVMFDREGNIWISRDKRLSVLRHGLGQLEDVPNQVHLVTSMIQSRNGEIWLGDAWRAIRRFSDPSAKAILLLKGKPEILVDSHDNLWVAQDDQGLLRILHISDNSTSPVIEHGTDGDLTSQQVHALLEDREGNIWVGTERGLDRFRETPFVHFLDAGLHSFPSLVAADDGSVWIDSLGSSLMHVVDGKTVPVGLKVHSGPFAKRRNGDICFMDMISYEVQCYGRDAPVHVKITAPTRHVHSLAMVEDTDASLLISFQGEGLWRYSNGIWDQPTAPGLPKSSPWSMFSDAQGRLWLGYGNDAIVVRMNGVYRTLQVGDGTWSNTLTFFQTQESVWAAGSIGLALFDGNQFKRVQSLEANLLQGTSGIAQDQQGNLWLNAGAGVLRISSSEVALLLRDPNHPVKIDVFDENDGLLGQPTQFKRGPSAISDAHGRLWFSMSGDVVSLDPSKLGHGKALPSVLVESVLVDGKSALRAPGQPGAVLYTDTAHLHDLEINFIGISLSAPERVYYRYRLVGEDKGWQDAGKRRQAFYTRLSPGTYQFLVSASNGEDWNDLPVPLRIIVRPAFYQTWWFATLVVLLAIFVASEILRARMRYVAEQVHSKLSERVAERERVARELHDTLLQGFQGLLMRFHLATQSIPTSETARTEMEDALDSADSLLVESRERIRDLRHESIELAPLSEALTALGEEFAVPRNWELKVIAHGMETDLNPITYQDIYAVSKEALVNAFRHSRASAIRADLYFEPHRLQIEVTDNGIGIDPGILSGGRREDHWGLAGMQERADNLGAELKLGVPPGGGTRVQLVVPGAMAYRHLESPKVLGTLYRAWAGRFRKPS